MSSRVKCAFGTFRPWYRKISDADVYPDSTGRSKEVDFVWITIMILAQWRKDHLGTED